MSKPKTSIVGRDDINQVGISNSVASDNRIQTTRSGRISGWLAQAFLGLVVALLGAFIIFKLGWN